MFGWISKIFHRYPPAWMTGTERASPRYEDITLSEREKRELIAAAEEARRVRENAERFIRNQPKPHWFEAALRDDAGSERL